LPRRRQSTAEGDDLTVSGRFTLEPFDPGIHLDPCRRKPRSR
jgi:hypothetical protein